MPAGSVGQIPVWGSGIDIKYVIVKCFTKGHLQLFAILSIVIFLQFYTVFFQHCPQVIPCHNPIARRKRPQPAADADKKEPDLVTIQSGERTRLKTIEKGRMWANLQQSHTQISSVGNLSWM